MKNIILVLSILIAFVSCNQDKSKVNEDDNSVENKIPEEEFNLPKSQYVVFTYDNSWDWIFTEVTPTELSNTELIEIEKIINTAVDEYSQEYGDTDLKDKFSTYKRQYVPVINKNGEKEIWVNFFCDDFGNDNWKSDIMIVHDGGNCFFNVKINLTQKKYTDFMVNGLA